MYTYLLHVQRIYISYIYTNIKEYDMSISLTFVFILSDEFTCVCHSRLYPKFPFVRLKSPVRELVI